MLNNSKIIDVNPEKGKEALFEATDELSKRINELEVQIKSK